MKTIKNFEGINKNNIINMELIAADQGEPAIAITELIDGIIYESQFLLTQGFQVHMCNEFLLSLNLGAHISFDSYGSYKSTISSSMTLLKVQRIIEAAGAGVSAYDVKTLLLDDKDDFGFNALTVGLQNGHLAEYVQQAIELLNKKAVKSC